MMLRMMLMTTHTLNMIRPRIHICWSHGHVLSIVNYMGFSMLHSIWQRPRHGTEPLLIIYIPFGGDRLLPICIYGAVSNYDTRAGMFINYRWKFPIISGGTMINKARDHSSCSSRVQPPNRAWCGKRAAK